MFFTSRGGYVVKGAKMAYADKIKKLKEALDNADAVIVGAGAGLSTAAGYTYTGDKFKQYFADFEQKYGFHDMYSGGFYPYENLETFWAYWSRYIWINRYMPIPSDVYADLCALVKDRDYFVLTTNVDHCFQRAGFDKKRLFYTQGDYGLFQSSEPSGVSAHKTYDNEDIIRAMLVSQGYTINDDLTLSLPDGAAPAMQIASDLVPVCSDDGKPMTTNLRCDDTFVEDDGWHVADNRYQDFLRRHDNLNVLFLELGVGMNTPVIIKYPFWRMTERNPNAMYACINYGEAGCSANIEERSICIDSDITRVLRDLKEA